MNAQPSLPTHIDLMWPTMEAIKQLGGSGTNQEIFDKIIENEKYPEEELGKQTASWDQRQSGRGYLCMTSEEL